METPQSRHLRQDRVYGHVTASGAAGGGRPRRAGREGASVPATVTAASVDGREMVAGSRAADAAGMRAGRRRGPS